MREPAEHSISSWVVSALRTPTNGTTAQRVAIMERVRREPAPRRLSAPMRASRWSRRGLLTPFGGMSVFAMLVAVVSLRALEQRDVRGVGALQSSIFIRGDTVVPANDAGHAGVGRRDGTHADSIAERVMDTLRIVEFVLRGPAVRSVAVIGDFNAWRRGATTLALGDDGAWRARVLVPRDALRFAYVVNGAQVVSPPPPRRAPSAHRMTPDSI